MNAHWNAAARFIQALRGDNVSPPCHKICHGTLPKDIYRVKAWTGCA
jgi:hypothetical protein